MVDFAKIPMSPARAAGDFIFLAGQLGFDEQRRIVEGGIGAQTTAALANIKALLAQQGAGMADIVKATVWITDKADFAGYNAAYAAGFDGVAVFPARSTVVSDLVVEGALIEIEVIAYRKG